MGDVGDHESVAIRKDDRERARRIDLVAGDLHIEHFVNAVGVPSVLLHFAIDDHASGIPDFPRTIAVYATDAGGVEFNLEPSQRDLVELVPDETISEEDLCVLHTCAGLPNDVAVQRRARVSPPGDRRDRPAATAG